MANTRPAVYRSLTVPLLLLAFLLGGLTTLVAPEPLQVAEAASGCATASFAPQQAFPLASPKAVVMGDINGDGRPDLAIPNFEFSSHTVSVLLNTTLAGAATASFAPHQTFLVGANPRDAALGDLNGDGRLDLVVANSPDTVSVLLNTTAAGAATASLAAQQTFTVGDLPVSVVIGDLNGDGRQDVAVANNSGASVSVLLNTTLAGAITPSFSPQQVLPVSGVTFSIVTGDVNGDGRLDIAVSSSPNRVSVLLNTTAAGAATASFAPPQTFAAGSLPSSVAMDDVNSDGRPDLAVTNQLDNSVAVLLNMTVAGATTASFAPAQTFLVGISPSAVAMGDVSGDGRPDLIVANSNIFVNTVSVLLNTTTAGAGTPSFAPQQTFPVGIHPSDVAIGDLNGDGRMDLAVANSPGIDTVSVLLNICIALPTVTTISPATNITFSTATLSGNITSEGGAALSARGIVVALASVNPLPTLGGTGVVVLTDASSVPGAFSENAMGLLEAETYAFRAFATNSAGTGYGNVVTFTTAAPTGALTPTPTLLLSPQMPVIPQGLQNPQALGAVQAGNRATPTPPAQALVPTAADPGRIAIQPPRTGDGGLRPG